MVLAIVLILIVVAEVLFQFLSPWWSPVGSNSGYIDDTLISSLVMRGVVFVAVNLSIAGRHGLSWAARESVDNPSCSSSLIAYDILPNQPGRPLWP